MHNAEVVSLRPFGAFVRLDGFRSNGLVHISQMANRFVSSADEVVREGEQVKVLVLSTSNNKISCSMKQVCAGPSICTHGRPPPRT